jgi:IclR family acetate operon transcriptional repressor
MIRSTLDRNSVRAFEGPQSVRRVLDLFEVLAKSANGLTLAELNALLACPKSSLRGLLRPLTANGYLNHDNGRYRLAPAAFRLAGNIISVSDGAEEH